MKGNGYESFFKQARKASQPAGKTSRPVPSKARPKVAGLKASELSAEERLRRELANRLKSRQKTALQKRKKVPVYPVICASVALIACTFAYLRADVLEDLVSKIEIGAFGEAFAADATEKPAEKPAEKKEETSSQTAKAEKEKHAETKVAEKPAASEGSKQWSPEEVSFFSKLNDRKKELDLREAELSRMEEELQKRKAELDEKLKRLESMRTDISKTLKTRVAADQQKVDKLVEFYSNMKPQQAAKVIETINEDLAVEVLDKMKKKNAAEIMNMVNAKKARRLSELMTGYERTVASDDSAESAKAAEKPADAKGGNE